MKITEIKFGSGKTYVDEKGIAWKDCGFGLFDNLTSISDFYLLTKILEMNFEEQVDWSKVEVDTPILVKIDDCWDERHFAKYENGKVFYYSGGTTSWTNVDCRPIEAKEAKLGDTK